MFVFLLLALGVACILPVCSGTPFKLPFSNISLCFCLSKKKTNATCAKKKKKRLTIFYFIV